MADPSRPPATPNASGTSAAPPYPAVSRREASSSGAAQLQTATCACCGSALHYAARGRQLPDGNGPTRVAFLEVALLRADPFAEQRTSGGAPLPLQVGAVCSQCGAPVCLRRACGLFYTRRFCAKCARADASSFPPECRKLEAAVFSGSSS
mmetsp:Transcript_9125/g.23151  ORF Transcript_9125/g.23151 Transcript_9125/m.23151 type:complete len:151 (-) Transcript_9125:352-804(-)